MRAPTTRVGLVAALAATMAMALGPGVQAEEPSTQAEEIWVVVARPIIARLPKVAAGMFNNKLAAWDRVKPAERRKLERWLDLLAPLDATQLAELFAPAAKVKPEEMDAKVAEILETESIERTKTPADEPTRVVIVSIGGEAGLSQLLAKALENEAPSNRLVPRCVTDIRPWGALYTRFNAKLMGDLFLGRLLTGRKDTGITVHNGNRMLAAPLLGEVYRWRMDADESARDAWILYRGVDLACDNSLDKRFRDGKRQFVALWGKRFNNVVGKALDERITDRRREDPSPFDFGLDIAGTPAGTLRTDRNVSDTPARNFLARQAGQANGAPLDSDVFIARVACDLLRSSMEPKLVIVRLGVPTPRPGLRPKEARDAAVRDTDALVGSIWDAARADPRWRQRTYFWLIVEGSNICCISGPEISAGTRVKDSASLTQVMPTALWMLGFDPAAALDKIAGADRKPIEFK